VDNEERVAFVRSGIEHYGAAIRACLRFVDVVREDLLAIASEIPALPGWEPKGDVWSQFTKSAWNAQPWIGVGRPGEGEEGPFGTAGKRSLHIGLVWWEGQEPLAYVHFDPNLRRLADWSRGRPMVRPFKNQWFSYLVTTPSADLRTTFGSLVDELRVVLAEHA
jgi:hypothetical protein